MATQKQKDRDEAISQLKQILKPGDTVYTICTYVSRSGMKRRIKALVVRRRKGEKPYLANVSWWVATAIDWRWEDDAVVVGGCGMDLGFHLTYTLGRVLFPKGGPLRHSPRECQERCGGRTRETDGGYLLKHEWV